MLTGTYTATDVSGVPERASGGRIHEHYGASTPLPARAEQCSPTVGTFPRLVVAPLPRFREVHGSLNVLVRMNRPRHPGSQSLRINAATWPIVPIAERAPCARRQSSDLIGIQCGNLMGVALAPRAWTLLQSN